MTKANDWMSISSFARIDPNVMSELVSLAVTPHQRELLMEGLRYVRSARRYEFRETSAPPDARRDGDIQDITGLLGQLEGSATAAVPNRS